MEQLGKHYTVGALLRYTLPMVAMMLVTSAYAIVDGLFVSNVVGKEALASVTIVMPLVMVLSALGMMMGAGGSAIVGQLLGAQRRQEACQAFSALVLFTFLAGVVASVVGLFVMDGAVRLLGASEELAGMAALYGRIAFLSLPLFMMQYAFEMFSATSGKPGLGLASSLVAGFVNIGLDALFLLVFQWGIAGAAWATCVAEYAAGIFMLVVFWRGKSGALRLVRPVGNVQLFVRAALNGLSEMVGTVSMSVVAVVYNVQLMSLYGADGVAAYAVIEYASMVVGSALGGMTEGIAPLMSYQHGACRDTEKRSLFRKGLALTCLVGITLFVAAQMLAWPLVFVFMSYDAGLMALSVHAFRIYALAYVFMGFSFFCSSMFTAVENGKVSAAISVVHTLLFEVGSVLLLPLVMGPDGVWWAIVVAEVASTTMCAALLVRYAPRYGWVTV